MSSKYTALIVYSSITGNTEKIANAFAETFREYNIEPTLMKLEGNYLGEQMDPPDTGAYDFLCLGAPVIAAQRSGSDGERTSKGASGVFGGCQKRRRADFARTRRSGRTSSHGRTRWTWRSRRPRRT